MLGEKSINYTAEQETDLVRLYLAEVSVDELAERFDKSTRSIVAKLSRLGVYKSKTKTSGPKLTKAELVTQIAAILCVDETAFETFAKADKPALEKLLATLQAKMEV
jgi:hypothetical protein